MADTMVSTANPAQTPNPDGRSRRGDYRGRNRGRGRGGTPLPPANSSPHSSASTRTTGHGRTFGGQLSAPQLDATANPFVPASIVPPTKSGPSKPSKSLAEIQSNTSTPSNVRAQPPPRKQRRPSRSQAPDLATRLHEDIAHGLYECAICANEITRHSKIWSCHTCWTVFHLGCIKKWSKNEGSLVQQSRGAQEGAESAVAARQWRCPGCNLPKDVFPSSYTCWCEKELDPKMLTGLPSHSCGQTCGRDRKFPRACPHPCDQLCHAGPCPPCTAMGPRQSCFCGKQESTRRCVDTEYEAGWSCGAICGDIMPCGEHTCPKPCHEGLCGACEVRIDSKCYCGKVEQQVLCSEQDEAKQSYNWVGTFDCNQTCGRPLDCGIHECRRKCHPQDEQVPHCPRSPDAVTHCPCGKTSLHDLEDGARTVCTDPIPSCEQPCAKTMSCGHSCPKPCHTGDCPPCFLNIPITCRCGRNKFESLCCGSLSEPPQCFKVCKATLNCGRHECGERCCTGERKAIERQATKRKLKPLGVAHLVDEGFEAEHICTRVCGRPLKCGNHFCAELCHKGPCGTCREAIFAEIACNCGRTILQPPLPCGTRPPHCNFPCNRSKTCGHPSVAHNCHTDEEECPKCPFLTEKKCLCSKKTLKNQPCWRADVLCGLVCGKKLKCGSHACRKTCHRSGECEDADVHCQQECGKPKKTCGHACEQPCHAPSTCKEDKPCPFKIIITCDCQRKKEEVRCNARASAPEPPGRQNSLKCDEECGRLERNRTLKEALRISDDHMDDHVPYSSETLHHYLADVAWAHQQEEILRIFAADDHERRYRFPPMKKRQRAFLHSIAEDFGFDNETLDPEPHRHVMLFKTPRFVAAPMKTLQQAARIRRGQLSVQASSSTEQPSEKRANEGAKNSWNGILLRSPRFALTEDELQTVLRSAAPTTEFDVFFLSSSDAVALIPQHRPEENPIRLSSVLITLLPSVSQAIVKGQMAATVVLAVLDTTPLAGATEPKIRAQSDLLTGSSTGGWSQVAAKRSIPAHVRPTQPPVIGQKSTFTVLGSKLAEAKRRKAEEKELAKRRAEMERDAVDDWSQEADADTDEGLATELHTTGAAGSETNSGIVTPKNETEALGEAKAFSGDTNDV